LNNNLNIDNEKQDCKIVKVKGVLIGGWKEIKVRGYGREISYTYMK
jgi:hypothetical protein